MTDYTELVKALRCCTQNPPETCVGCTYNIGNNECAVRGMMCDAAAAIEALQAELIRICKQLPKRGKWVEDTTTYAGPGLSNYKCSLCGKICGTWRRGLKPSELPNWCGNCGADMRKMEVQE